jgi:hypothetical protein
VGHAAYIIDESGANVLKITLMERVSLRLSEVKGTSATEMVQRWIELLIDEGDFEGRLYGVVRFFRRSSKDAMFIGLAYSTGELKPDFSDPDWHIMTPAECSDLGLHTEPEVIRVSRFEREEVI